MRPAPHAQIGRGAASAIAMPRICTQTVQLRAVKSAWEIKAYEATCGDGLALQRGLVGQREGGSCPGRAFDKRCYHCLGRATHEVTSRAGRPRHRDALLKFVSFRKQIGEVYVVDPRERKLVWIYGRNRKERI